MHTCRVIGRLTAAALLVSAAVVLVPSSNTTVSAASDRLRLNFDGHGPAGTVLGAGAAVADVSGFQNSGVVVTAFAGSVGLAAGASGGGADFPNKCSREPCPNALIAVRDHASLDPLTAEFEWGARVLLQANETDDGENVLQKGLYLEPGGQWKLQVDKAGGFPSCVVSGRVPGQSTERRVVLIASVSIANGVWHQVTCRRTAAGVQIVVDGVVRGTTSMPLVSLNSAADVSIGSKWVTSSDNDQFHGVVDDVFMTVLDGSPPPNTPPVAAFDYECSDLTCTFDGSRSTDNGPITYTWLFEDGTTEIGVASSHTFAAIGDHPVTLTVTDGSGLTSSITHTISIAENTAPRAAFTSTCIALVMHVRRVELVRQRAPDLRVGVRRRRDGVRTLVHTHVRGTG